LKQESITTRDHLTATLAWAGSDAKAVQAKLDKFVDVAAYTALSKTSKFDKELAEYMGVEYETAKGYYKPSARCMTLERRSGSNSQRIFGARPTAG
jgi:hypothetical protein